MDDDRGEAWVVLTNIVGHDGSLNPGARDRIVMAVSGITREVAKSGFPAPSVADAARGGAMAAVAPSLFLDVHLIFMANFGEDGYGDGLAALSRLIAFFQQTPVFTRSNVPDLDPAIDRLTLDFEDLDPVDLNYVMGMMGTRYLPSVFYKLRMLSFTSSAVRERVYPVVAAGAGVTTP